MQRIVGAGGILIVEGNPHLRSLLGWHLQQVGYAVYQSASVHQAQESLYERQPLLVILDSELPDGDGLEFCRWIEQQHTCLILMLSARSAEADVVAGLRAGADDYITKPFGMQEFMARVEALVRRFRQVKPPTHLDYGDLHIDLVQRRVRLNGQLIELTPQEFSLLYVLAGANGVPLSRSELLKKAWPEAIDNPRTIDTHILSLRKKIEIDPRQPNRIQTVRNVGYRFNREQTDPESSEVPGDPDALDDRQRSHSHTTNPAVTNGQAQNGQARNGQAQNGQTRNGQATNGQIGHMLSRPTETVRAASDRGRANLN